VGLVAGCSRNGSTTRFTDMYRRKLLPTPQTAEAHAMINLLARPSLHPIPAWRDFQAFGETIDVSGLNNQYLGGGVVRQRQAFRYIAGGRVR
jgi:hypothetical protein